MCIYNFVYHLIVYVSLLYDEKNKYKMIINHAIELVFGKVGVEARRRTDQKDFLEVGANRTFYFTDFGPKKPK